MTAVRLTRTAVVALLVFQTTRAFGTTTRCLAPARLEAFCLTRRLRADALRLRERRTQGVRFRLVTIGQSTDARTALNTHNGSYGVGRPTARTAIRPFSSDRRHCRHRRAERVDLLVDHRRADT